MGFLDDNAKRLKEQAKFQEKVDLERKDLEIQLNDMIPEDYEVRLQCLPPGQRGYHGRLHHLSGYSIQLAPDYLETLTPDNVEAELLQLVHFCELSLPGYYR